VSAVREDFATRPPHSSQTCFRQLASLPIVDEHEPATRGQEVRRQRTATVPRWFRAGRLLGIREQLRNSRRPGGRSQCFSSRRRRKRHRAAEATAHVPELASRAAAGAAGGLVGADGFDGWTSTVGCDSCEGTCADRVYARPVTAHPTTRRSVHARFPTRACVGSDPSLSTSGETRTIEESMTLRARTESAGHVEDEYERRWCPSCG
jgi:hypothetical protein